MLITNSVYPDQTPHYVASDLGLHCLPLTGFLERMGYANKYHILAEDYKECV